MAHRLPTARRQEEIGEAALALLGRGGLAALGTRALADAVGLSSGALFRHFPSLDAVLAEAARLAAARLAATLPEPGQAPAARLEGLARARVRLLRKEPGIAWLLSSEQALKALPADARKALQAVADRTRRVALDALREGASRGELRGDLPAEDLLPVVTGTIHSLAGGGGIRRQGAPHRAGSVESCLSALIQLLRPPKPKP